MKNTKLKIPFSQIVKETGYKHLDLMFIPSLFSFLFLLVCGAFLVQTDTTPLIEFMENHNFLLVCFSGLLAFLWIFLESLVTTLLDLYHAWIRLRKKARQYLNQ